MGQDRSSVSCDDEQAEAIREAQAQAQAQPGIADLMEVMEPCSVTGTGELPETVAVSLVMHAARIEDLRRRVEVLEADRAALREALKEAFVSR
jgi:hypothetical protein